MFKGLISSRYYYYLELLAIALSICILPIDRFPYLHYIPLKLGAISFVLLLVAASIRAADAIADKRNFSLKRIGLAGSLLLLPVVGYAQSIHYAIDRPYATGATKLLLVAALKALCFFILLEANPKLWIFVKRTIYIVTAIVVAFGFFQFVFDVLGASTKITDLRSCCTSNSTYVFPRVHSVSLEPLYFTNFLLIPLWLMIFDFIFDKSQRRNRWLIALAITTGTLFVLSLARSAMLALVVSALIFGVAIKSWGMTKKTVPYLLKGVLVIIIIALAFVMLSALASKHIHKTAINGSDAGVKGNLSIFSSHAVAVADQSAQTRYSTWPKALDYIKENPIKGVGAYNSRVRLNLSAYKGGVQDINLQPFNNDLIGLLVDLGLVGVLAFGPVVAALFVSLVKTFKQGWTARSSPYALAAIAMLIQSNFFQSILLARLWVVVGIALTGIYMNSAAKPTKS